MTSDGTVVQFSEKYGGKSLASTELAPPSKSAHGFSYQSPELSNVQGDSSVRSSDYLPSKSKTTQNTANNSSSPSLLPDRIDTSGVPIHQSHSLVGFQAGLPRSNSVPTFSSKKEISRSLSSTPTSSTNKSAGLRRGKWTVEEEAYVARVIQYFNNGYLDAPTGTTLRTFLSDKLNCNPMRITKKFTGDSCIGKRVFHPAVRSSSNAAAIDNAQSELVSLERRWKRRLEIQQRESAKKRAAAAVSESLHMRGIISNLPPAKSSLQHSLNTSSNGLAQTASWLDRANAILSNTQYRKEESTSIVVHEDSVKKEMEEVQRLIHEGPIIQKASAGLIMASNNDSSPKCFPSLKPTSTNAPSKRKVPDDQDGSSTSNSKLCVSRSSSELNSTSRYIGYERTINFSKSVPSSGFDVTSEVLPNSQAKGLRKAHSTSDLYPPPPSADSCFTDTVEDAATLLGFLSSVRQAAASKNKTLPSETRLNQEY